MHATTIADTVLHLLVGGSTTLLPALVLVALLLTVTVATAASFSVLVMASPFLTAQAIFEIGGSGEPVLHASSWAWLQPSSARLGLIHHLRPVSLHGHAMQLLTTKWLPIVPLPDPILLPDATLEIISLLLVQHDLQVVLVVGSELVKSHQGVIIHFQSSGDDIESSCHAFDIFS